MNLMHQGLAMLALGACVAMFTQADARPRGGKHGATAMGHVGAHHPGGTANGRGNASSVAPAPVRNAIGVATQPAAVAVIGAAKTTSVAVKPNAINTRTGTGAVLPSVPAGTGKIGSTMNPANAVRAAPSAPPAHAGGINGTGMARPSSAPGTIGGPAKIAGGISGTGMRQKR